MGGGYLPNKCCVVLGVDGFNQASPGPSANQGQMMTMSGRGAPIGPEGSTNMGTPLMPENGAMVTYQRIALISECIFNVRLQESSTLSCFLFSFFF